MCDAIKIGSNHLTIYCYTNTKIDGVILYSNMMVWFFLSKEDKKNNTIWNWNELNAYEICMLTRFSWGATPLRRIMIMIEFMICEWIIIYDSLRIYEFESVNSLSVSV